jgi:hypothetical protein
MPYLKLTKFRVSISQPGNISFTDNKESNEITKAHTLSQISCAVPKELAVEVVPIPVPILTIMLSGETSSQ